MAAAEETPSSTMPVGASSVKASVDEDASPGYTNPHQGHECGVCGPTAMAAKAAGAGEGEPVVRECNLRFLMVTGANFTFRAMSDVTIGQLKRRIIDDRPKEMVDSLLKAPAPQTPFPSKMEEIRLVHGGRFLDDPKTLNDYDFATGDDGLTTIHVTIKAPPSVLDDVKGKLNRRSNCCCTVQ